MVALASLDTQQFEEIGQKLTVLWYLLLSYIEMTLFGSLYVPGMTGFFRTNAAPKHFFPHSDHLALKISFFLFSKMDS